MAISYYNFGVGAHDLTSNARHEASRYLFTMY